LIRFATETIPYQEGIFKGNLRGEAEAVSSVWVVCRNGWAIATASFSGKSGRKACHYYLPSRNDPQSTHCPKNPGSSTLVATIAEFGNWGVLLGFLYQSVEILGSLPIGAGIVAVLQLMNLVIACLRVVIKFASVRPFSPHFASRRFAITRFESLVPNRKVLFDVALRDQPLEAYLF